MTADHFPLPFAVSIVQQVASVDMLISRLAELKALLCPPMASMPPPGEPLTAAESARGALELACEVGVHSRYAEYTLGVWGEEEGRNEVSYACFAYALADVVSAQGSSSAPRSFAEAAMRSEVWELLCKGGEGGVKERHLAEVAAKTAIMVLSCCIDRMEAHKVVLEASLRRRWELEALTTGLSATILLSLDLDPEEDLRLLKQGIALEINQALGLRPDQGVYCRVRGLVVEEEGVVAAELTIPNPPLGTMHWLGDPGEGGQGRAARLVEELQTQVRRGSGCKIHEGKYVSRATDLSVEWDGEVEVPSLGDSEAMHSRVCMWKDEGGTYPREVPADFAC